MALIALTLSRSGEINHCMNLIPALSFVSFNICQLEYFFNILADETIMFNF